MPTLNLGQVRPVYRGAWNSIDTYSAYDFVIYNGSAYLALKDVPANYEPPSQTEYWVLFGAKGEPGAPGADGENGAQGERGPSPAYRWDGTFLSIQNPDGTWPDQGIDLQGPAVPLSNSVTSTSETDAASSKAVKTAYDLASAALPKSGGTISGNISVVGGITVAAPDGESEGGQILLKNGTDGSYPGVIDTTQNQIRFFGGPSNPVSVDLETGRFVGNLTGKADTAWVADNSLAFANGRRWVEVIHEGNPGWLIGSVNEQLRPVNPSSLNVNYANSAGYANYANSAGYANARFLNTFAFATADTGTNLPAGGTWLVFAQWYSYGGDYWEVSGKQPPWIDYRAGGSRIEAKRLGFALRIS